MDVLRALFQELDLSNAETFIASGNVIFESPTCDTRELEARIEDRLRQSLGYAVATFIRTTAELNDIAAYQPFAELTSNDGDAALYIAFLSRAPDGKERQAIMALRTPTDDFHIHGRELYRLCRGRISESPVSEALLGKAIGAPATVRNANTVRRIAAKYPTR